ncbi:hypothetical protein GOZ80_14040 [Agrobacterium vitis]|uniref:hypothetical protein n=1 Tax=Agrobacterium vitis TaxID=373 RepID=UPI0008DBFE9C|nr:hypothetical protein [Agrobacterium vitis]MUO96596.1 hypothetical protein [Agrobacterium vitis]MVA93127.1 hypothetical protein [Agrobacterium vitis]MVB04026.1 hypothetical protein [Agrobacterium vitis]NSY12389.1 hypothetical protein [Agrobacterium vitis]NSY22218.1 hypothetical protein [Agrobacterium vitis]
MKLKLSEATELANAISQLGGQNKVVKEGGVEKAVIVPYAFGGDMRMTLARNLRILKGHVDDFSVARDALINEYSDGTGKIDPDHPKFSALNTAMADLGKQEIDVDLVLLKEADFRLGDNPIPPALLSSLLTIIE